MYSSLLLVFFFLPFINFSNVIFHFLFSDETFEFGCAQHTVPVDLLLKLESSINVSPCGVAFVNKDVRRGILPAMLEEILETRLMVRQFP